MEWFCSTTLCVFLSFLKTSFYLLHVAAISFLPEPTAQFSRAVQLPDNNNNYYFYQAVHVECSDLLNCSRLSKSRQIFHYYWYLLTVASLDLICFPKPLQLIFARAFLVIKLQANISEQNFFSGIWWLEGVKNTEQKKLWRSGVKIQRKKKKQHSTKILAWESRSLWENQKLRLWDFFE